MILSIRFHPEAQTELDEAYAWYEQQRNGLGEDFLSAIQEVLERVRQSPDLYARVFLEARRGLTRRFPYKVIYRVERDEIMVIAVYHGRRDPERWQTRYDFR